MLTRRTLTSDLTSSSTWGQESWNPGRDQAQSLVSPLDSVWLWMIQAALQVRGQIQKISSSSICLKIIFTCGAIYQYLFIKVTSFRVCKVIWIAHHVNNIFLLSDSGDARLIFGKDPLEDHLTLGFYKIQHLFVLCEGNAWWIRYDVPLHWEHTVIMMFLSLALRQKNTISHPVDIKVMSLFIIHTLTQSKSF